MVIRKKEIPLAVLEGIAPFLKKQNVKYKVVQSNNFLLKLEDLDPNSHFYFVVKSFRVQNNKAYVKCEYVPRNKTDIGKYEPEVEIGILGNHINEWNKRLEAYDKTPYINDDPIVGKFTDEFFAEFRILDDDADVAPFSRNQLLYLDEYLDNASKIFAEYKSKASEEDFPFFEQLEEDVREIKKSMTREPKEQVMKRLSRVWGKAQKYSMKLIGDILIKIAAEISVKLITGQIS